MPHIFAHYAARKVTIEREVREALSAGFGQVVVVGAGFDTLGIRLAEEMPEFTVFEIDHPSTQHVKKNRGPKTRVQYIAADLRHKSVSQALAETEFKPDLPVVFVLEGLLMYLDEGNVRALFEDLRGSHRRVVFTAMNLDENGRPGFKSQSKNLHSWLERRGEPFLWGCRPERMGEFLRSCNFELASTFDHTAIRHTLKLSAELTEGEIVYVAEGS